MSLFFDVGTNSNTNTTGTLLVLYHTAARPLLARRLTYGRLIGMEGRREVETA